MIVAFPSYLRSWFNRAAIPYTRFGSGGEGCADLVFAYGTVGGMEYGRWYGVEGCVREHVLDCIWACDLSSRLDQ